MRESPVPSRFVLRTCGLRLRPEGRGPFPLLVALHGWGMTVPAFRDLMRPLLPDGWALLVPEGVLPVEVDAVGGRRVGRAWYAYDGDQAGFRAWLEAGDRHVMPLVRAEAADPEIDRRRVHLLGYSQGAYLAGFTAFHHPRDFAGLVLAAGRLKHEFVADRLARARALRTLFVTGARDPGLPRDRLDEGKRALERAGVPVEALEHPGGHGLTREALQGIRAWLEASEDP